MFYCSECGKECESWGRYDDNGNRIDEGSFCCDGDLLHEPETEEDE